MRRFSWKSAALSLSRTISSALGDVDIRTARSRAAELGARHVELSALLSLDDAPGQPSDRLLDLAIAVQKRARVLSLPHFRERQAPSWAEIWPGEHYRLLSALVEETSPLLVIDIGTFTGLSALAMAPSLRPGARLVTVDITPWADIPGTHLRAGDFARWPLHQLIGDFGDAAVARAHADLLREADLLVVDAAKDGVFEQRLLDNLEAVGLKEGALLVFDDIRLWDMLGIWRGIRRPKLDLTSFGHWTGTGLVEWTLSQNPDA